MDLLGQQVDRERSSKKRFLVLAIVTGQQHGKLHGQ
jgi:hypothetical protein